LRQHDNSFFGDPVLFQLASQLGVPLLPELAELGSYTASEEAESRARLISRHPPLLHLYNSFGLRCEGIDVHPAYHSLITRARHAGIASSLFEEDGAEASVQYQARACRLFLLSGVECATSQELSYSSAALGILHSNDALCAEWKPLLISRIHDPLPKPYPQKQGASLSMAWHDADEAGQAQAWKIDEGGEEVPAMVRIQGTKNAVINPLADGFLITAALGGQSCLFLVPRLLVNGNLNHIHLASSSSMPPALGAPIADLYFSNSIGWYLGTVGQMEPVLRSAQQALCYDVNIMRVGLMRRALRLAIDKLRLDKKSGKIGKPQAALQIRILADAALDCAAATVLIMRLARAFDRRNQDLQELVFAELADPIISYWLAQITPQILDCSLIDTKLRSCQGNFHDRAYHFLSMNGGVHKRPIDWLLYCSHALKRHETKITEIIDDLATQSGAVGGQSVGVLQAAEQMMREDVSAACFFAEQFAYMLAAGLLQKLDMEIVASAFINSRLGGLWRSSYGLLSLRFNPALILETLFPSQ